LRNDIPVPGIAKDPRAPLLFTFAVKDSGPNLNVLL